MKKIISTLFGIVFSLALFGEELPYWADSKGRAFHFPNNEYLTGFAIGNIRSNEAKEKAIARIIKEAQGYLSESIRVKVKSEVVSQTRSTKTNGSDQLDEAFESAVKTVANAEIVGMKTDSYYDKDESLIYAFAYANKFEVIGYYKANISMLLQQAEGNLATAEDLEQSGEKAKARKQCEGAIPSLAKVRYAQDLLTAVDAADSESLQQEKSESLRNKATQMLARLAQGLYVYVESKEDNLGKSSNVLVNKMKAILAHSGCSFTDDVAEADLKLRINASTRTISGEQSGIVFCYADVEVELFDNHKQKVVFNDEFSQKGGSTTNERAGKKAMEDAAPKVAEKLEPWIKN